jgi:hypothetical protein
MCAARLAEATLTSSTAVPWDLLAACCSVLALLVPTVWALLERRERRAWQRQSSLLSEACHQLTEQHYRERVQSEERHLLVHDSSVRNVLESLERALLGKPRS